MDVPVLIAIVVSVIPVLITMVVSVILYELIDTYSFVSCGGVAGGGSMMIEVVGSISPVALSVVVLLGVEV